MNCEYIDTSDALEDKKLSSVCLSVGGSRPCLSNGVTNLDLDGVECEDTQLQPGLAALRSDSGHRRASLSQTVVTGPSTIRHFGEQREQTL